LLDWCIGYVLKEQCAIDWQLKLETVRISTRAVWIGRRLTLLLRVGTLRMCGDGLFFEVPPLASDALLITLHPPLNNRL
jgi:hypothetical protein